MWETVSDGGKRERKREEDVRERSYNDVEFEGGADEEGCAGGRRVGQGRNRTRVGARARGGRALTSCGWPCCESVSGFL